MRRCPDLDEPLHRDCKIHVTGKPYGSTRKVGLCTSMLSCRGISTRGDPVEKAVTMLAKKEVLLFAATVRSRICCGNPNKEHNKESPTFGTIVDNNVDAFQRDVDMTGMWHVRLCDHMYITR